MVLLLSLNTALAAPSIYTQHANFIAELPGDGVSLSFDTLPANTLIPSGVWLNGITFHYDFGGVMLKVGSENTAGYSTTSSSNFLGTNDADILQDGDSISLSFAPVNAIGLYIISNDELLDNDVTLSAGGTSVNLVAANSQDTLADGSSVYFLGISDPLTSFTTASLTTAGNGEFLFNVDDIITSVTASANQAATVHLNDGNATSISNFEYDGMVFDVAFEYGTFAEVNTGSNFPYYGQESNDYYYVMSEITSLLNSAGATGVDAGGVITTGIVVPQVLSWELPDMNNVVISEYISMWREPSYGYAPLSSQQVWVTLTPVPMPTAVVKRLSGLSDVSGDGVADLAHVLESAASTVAILSGSDGSTVRQIEFFGDDWNAVAISTLLDGNLDGVSNDPAIAMLARHSVSGLHRVRVRDGLTGERVGSDATFFNSSYSGIDMGVLNDHNGDGVANDPSILVLAKQDTGRVAVLVKRFSDGAVLGNWTFTKPDFDALAVEGVSVAGGVPAISVLYQNSNTGKSRIRTRRADNGEWMQGMFVAGSSREPRDFAVLADLNGDGAKDDQAYAILLKKEGGGSNVVRFRNVATGNLIREMLLVSGDWGSNSLAVLPDTNANGFDELAGDSERIEGQDNLIKIRDYDTGNSLQNIFH